MTIRWNQTLKEAEVRVSFDEMVGDRWGEQGLLWLWDRTTKTRVIHCFLKQGIQLILRLKGTTGTAVSRIIRDGYETILMEEIRLDLREPTDVQGWMFAALSAYDREVKEHPWMPHPGQPASNRRKH